MSEEQAPYAAASPDWVPCAEAAALVRDTGGGWSALDALIARLRSGAIEAVARRAIFGRSVIGEGRFVEAETQPDWPVPREFWADGAYQKSKAQWRVGDFVSEIEARRSLSAARDGVKRGFVVTELQGVRFRRDQLEAEFGAVQAAKDEEEDARRGGSPGKVAVWHDFWAAAMRLMDEGDLDSIASQAELRRRLLSEIGDRLSEDTIKPQVQRIWYAFRDRAG